MHDTGVETFWWCAAKPRRLGNRFDCALVKSMERSLRRPRTTITPVGHLVLSRSRLCHMAALRVGLRRPLSPRTAS